MCVISLKDISDEKLSRLDSSECQDLTAKVCCVSKAKNVKEEGTKKKFLSPRKHIKHSKKSDKSTGLPERCFMQNCFRIL
jgi:hypothetical protein